MKDLSRHYAQLTSDERFRLFFDAAGRRDVQEMDRLNDSCPRKQYLTDDWEYMIKKVWFSKMALYESRVVARLEMIATLGLVLALAHDEDDERTPVIESILDQALSQREATMVAWERFCAQVGIKPESVGTTLGPSDGQVWSLIEDAIHSAGMSPDLDEQRVQECLARLTELWAERTAT
ncbi:MAG TPA: hypothetical protein VFJ68_13580 [Casimicrobiaceae bacterium]|nr:hypothetical protein [Casimicrobiaceae bacterium]